jgi:hypothetical protein
MFPHHIELNEYYAFLEAYLLAAQVSVRGSVELSAVQISAVIIFCKKDTSNG